MYGHQKKSCNILYLVRDISVWNRPNKKTFCSMLTYLHYYVVHYYVVDQAKVFLLQELHFWVIYLSLLENR